MQRPMAGANNHSICDWRGAFRHKARMGQFSGSSLLKEIAPLLVKSFPGAWVAVFCAAVYMLMGYWLIALLTLWLGYFLQRQKAIKVLLALYILTILSIKLPIMSRPPFCYLTGINHWVLLLHNLTAGWRFPLTVIVTLLFVVTVICSIQGGWRSAAHIGIFCSLQVIFLCLPYCSLCWSGGSGVLAEFQSMVVSGSFGCWPDMAQDISIRSDLWHCYWRSCSLYGRWADFLYRQRAKTRLF